MKIALIIHELQREGGGERQCVALARALSGQRHDVVIFTSAYDPEHCFPEICKDLNVKELGRGWFPSIRRPFLLRGYLDMARLSLLVNEGYDIWNPHHWPAQWGAVWLKKKLGGLVVWMCNDVPDFRQKASQFRPLSNALQVPLRWLYYLIDCVQNRNVDLTLFLSKWAEKEFQAIYPGRTHVVRSGCDPESFKSGGEREKMRAKFGYKNDDFVLLWLGIFMPHRRLEDPIKAIALLAKKGIQVKLLLAGSESFYPEYSLSIRQLVRTLGLEAHVTFAGKVPDRAIRDYYCACDTFVFPNERQTWGLAVFEAMACGRPVLVSRGAAVHEVLTDHEDSLIFPPRNPDALAEKIEFLLSNPQFRVDIAQRGMQLVLKEYNWQRFAEQMIAVFKAVSDRTRSDRPLDLSVASLPTNAESAHVDC